MSSVNSNADRVQARRRAGVEPGRRPTVADVAREAAVSRATVSYVLNEKPNHRIPPKTAERVQLVAERLGYTPSAAARALKLGRSDVVLGLLPDWPIGHTQGRVLQLLSIEFEAAGLTFMAHPGTRSRHGWSPGEWRGVTPIAVISFEPMEESEAEAITTEGILIEPWFSVPEPGDPGAAGRPFRGVGRSQVEYLASVGHRRLGYAYPVDPRVKPFADARLAGGRDACARLGLPEPAVQLVALDLASATDAVRAWTAGDSGDVTAVCAYNDEVAIALLAAAEQLGIAVPDRLAVIGVEDIPTAVFAHPPLTTIALDNQPHARFVVASLLARLRGTPPLPHPAGGDHRIIVRASA